jgi:hypothetical protein
MEFTQRGAQQTAPTQASAGAPTQHSGGSSKKRKKSIVLLRIISMILLVGASVVVLALVALSALGGPVRESKYIEKKNFQAVFLNNGQVYFGHITSLNSNYMRVANIYYLRQSQSPQPDTSKTTTANSNLSLVKLGCEIHGPSDEMLINRSQVTFWENLKGDGQVAKAVATFVQQNPQGQKCQTS